MRPINVDFSNLFTFYVLRIRTFLSTLKNEYMMPTDVTVNVQNMGVCCICQESLLLEEIRTLNCSHEMHLRCITNYIAHTSKTYQYITCPICRQMGYYPSTSLISNYVQSIKFYLLEYNEEILITGAMFFMFLILAVVFLHTVFQSLTEQERYHTFMNIEQYQP